MTMATTAGNVGKVTWTVTSQMPATRPGPGGAFQAGVTISFTLTTGAQGRVFVPETQLNVATARQMIAQKAAVLAGIGSLTS